MAARQSEGRLKGRFFSRLAAITEYLIFATWDEPLESLAFTKPPPRPP